MMNTQKVVYQDIIIGKEMKTLKHFKYRSHSIILDYDKRKET